ncbi:hypothetical protein YC2023_029500 [Brassica napus]
MKPVEKGEDASPTTCPITRRSMNMRQGTRLLLPPEPELDATELRRKRSRTRGRTVQPNRLQRSSNRGIRLVDLRFTKETSTAFNRSKNLRLSYMRNRTSLKIKISLKMRKPKRMGEKRHRRRPRTQIKRLREKTRKGAGEDDAKGAIVSRKQKPAKLMLKKPSLPRKRSPDERERAGKDTGTKDSSHHSPL